MNAALLLVASCLGQAGPARSFVGPPRPVELSRLCTPVEAQTLALADVLTLPAIVRPQIRYVWLQEPSAERIKSLSATLNRVGRNAIIFRPEPLGENRLLRVDLTKLTFDVEQDLKEIAEVWEKLRFDPRFNLLLTPETLKVVLALPEAKRPLALVRDGKDFKPVRLEELAEADVVRLVAGHLDSQASAQLQAETGSAAAIVSAEYFEFRALASIKGKGAYTTIWGGLYYEFKGIKKAAKGSGKTDLDTLLERLGATGKRVAEQRVGMFRSGVTMKPRAIDFLPATNLRIGDGQGAVVVTHDIRDDSIEPSQHAMQTLSKAALKPDGHEVINIGANGFLEYSLFNGKSELVDEVPQEIASDTTVPGQHTKRLQAASSCIACHEAEGSDGWKTVKNDVQTLIEKGFDVFGDVSDPSRRIDRTVQELAAQYKGRPEKFIRGARYSLQAAILEATGAWEKTKPTDVVKVTAKRLEADRNAYWYDDVTPAKALSEFGFQAVPKAQSITFLKRLLPPDLESRAFGIVPEDVRIAWLLADQPASRQDFALVYAFGQFRAQRELLRMKGNRP